AAPVGFPAGGRLRPTAVRRLRRSAAAEAPRLRGVSERRHAPHLRQGVTAQKPRAPADAGPAARWTPCTEGGTMSVVTIAEALPAAGRRELTCFPRPPRITR